MVSRRTALHEAGRLSFYGSLAQLGERRAFLRHLAPVRKKRWVVYAKPPFAGPETAREVAHRQQVATQCRSVWGLTRLRMPAPTLASTTTRCNCRVLRGLR